MQNDYLSVCFGNIIYMLRPFAINTESNTKMIACEHCNIVFKIVTGLTAYANLPSLYAETRWGKLNTRFQIRKLSLFYNIDKDDTHNYLSDLLPHTVNRAIINNL
jgi:hypothetical protein